MYVSDAWEINKSVRRWLTYAWRLIRDRNLHASDSNEETVTRCNPTFSIMVLIIVNAFGLVKTRGVRVYGWAAGQLKNVTLRFWVITVTKKRSEWTQSRPLLVWIDWNWCFAWLTSLVWVFDWPTTLSTVVGPDRDQRICWACSFTCVSL